MQRSLLVLLLALICIISCKKAPEPSVTKTTTPKGVDSIVGTYIGTTRVIDIIEAYHNGRTRSDRTIDTTMQNDTIVVSKITDTTFRLQFRWAGFSNLYLYVDTLVYKDSNSYWRMSPNPRYSYYTFDFFFYPKADSLTFLGYKYFGGYMAHAWRYVHTTFKGKK